MEQYAVVVTALPVEEGGCYLAYVPDLPGCMSDGDTPSEAIVNVQDAIVSWLKVNEEMGRGRPKAGAAVEKAQEHRRALISVIKAAVAAIEARDGHIVSLETKVEKLTALLEREPDEKYGIYASARVASELAC